MKAARLVSAVAVAIVANTPCGAQANPSVARLVGCYTLSLGYWSPSRPSEWQTPPGAFMLYPDAVHQALGRGSFVVEPRALTGTSRVDAFWHPLGADSVRIVWTTGFVGAVLRMQVRGDTLSGRVTVFHDAHDAGEPPDPTTSAVALRKACPTRPGHE